jgi:RHS repeat-associated protein
MEVTSAGVQRAYVMSGNAVVAQLNPNGSFYWLHLDHLGSGRKMTDTSGNMVYRAEFDPYGKLLYEWSSPTNLNTKKFTGYERDAATNLDYAQARMYSSDWGRFMSSDPGGVKTARLDSPKTRNRYAYTAGNPVNFIDPNGMDYWEPDWYRFYDYLCGIGFDLFCSRVSSAKSPGPSGGGGGGGGAGADARGGGIGIVVPIEVAPRYRLIVQNFVSGKFYRGDALRLTIAENVQFRGRAFGCLAIVALRFTIDGRLPDSDAYSIKEEVRVIATTHKNITGPPSPTKPLLPHGYEVDTQGLGGILAINNPASNNELEEAWGRDVDTELDGKEYKDTVETTFIVFNNLGREVARTTIRTSTIYSAKKASDGSWQRSCSITRG